MDETVVNGAQSFYKSQFGIGGKTERDTWLLGLTNSAPYLGCALIGCWLTEPMNKAFGRRGTVFISCLVSALACFWQAFTNTWWHSESDHLLLSAGWLRPVPVFIARFMLGFGIDPKSATTPIFAAECAPPRLRGALVMQWQMWMAFGVMLGYVADLAFYYVPDRGGIVGLNWRPMMGSAMIPAVFVCACCYMCPESPRWYLTKDRHADAFKAMCQLRFDKVQAARDLFYANALLQAEKESQGIGKQNRLKELFAIRRNRNAMIASEILMFTQQFLLERGDPMNFMHLVLQGWSPCRVSVCIQYLQKSFWEFLLQEGFLTSIHMFALIPSFKYSAGSEIFLAAGLSEVSALAASLGFGVVSWLFALPAFYTIDTFGRRNLLLTTFPLMASAYRLHHHGIHLFGMVYSPGEGPVPFTYSAAAYPLYIRPIGMSLATATTWFFNFVLAEAFTPTGAFGWYAGWNVVGFFLVLFFLPETKEKTLEELDAVLSVPLRRFARYGLAQFFFFWKRHVFRRDVAPPAVPVAGQVAYHREQFTQEKEHSPTACV
ncbi:hypothetical protein Ct61P_04804 [Colletotrichum tofieldiae]|nr:hypothetical protein Ct61P_04804 [Colletotrichum tofieldiae]